MGRSLGDLEQLLLLALLRLGGDASGFELIGALEERTGRSVSPGALYNVMQRMEGRDLVESYVGDDGPARGGRRRKHYRILPKGAAASAAAWRQVQGLAEGLESELTRLAQGES